MLKSEAVQVIAVLEAAYPNHPTKPETAMAYHLALEDLPYSVVNEAVRVALRTTRFFPTPAELRTIVAESLLRLPAPADAWGEVRRQIKHVGIYGKPEWSCPAVEAAVRSIGWREICLSPEDSHYERDAFVRAYEANRDRAMKSPDLGQIAAGDPAPPRSIREGAPD